MNKKKYLAVIGCGYWGANLVRNFNNINVLKSVVDTNEKSKQKVKKLYANIHFETSYKNILKDKDIKAVAIATPANSHYSIVKDALNHGKHVFVEKPLCLDLKQGKKLLKISKEKKLKLMVGHLMLYHPAYIKMKECIKKGLIGNIRYIYSNRLALGKLRKDEDVLWSFAPHDLSMILDLVKSKVSNVDAFGGSYVKKNIKDTSLTSISFKNGTKGHIFVSWLHAYKDQKLVVIGERGMIVFADTQRNENKLLHFKHRVGWKGEIPLAKKSEAKKIPFNFKKEPLSIECKSFINWIEKEKKPISDVNEGLEVLKVLNVAKKKLSKS